MGSVNISSFLSPARTPQSGPISSGALSVGDWIKRGKSLNHFQYPPTLPDDVTLEVFRADLRPIIEQKLESCMSRLDELAGERRRIVKVILRSKPRSVTRVFLKQYEAAVFSESYVIQKWVTYWLNLWSKVTKEEINLPKLTKFEDFELERARQFPFEQLGSTEFRKAGNKWFTKCPFHEEATASFCIFSDNKAKCFGCGWSGDTIQFLMDTKKLSFMEAVRQLL